MEQSKVEPRDPDLSAPEAPEAEPLVEIAPDEAVVRALAQSAHPIEWVEAHKSNQAS